MDASVTMVLNGLTQCQSLFVTMLGLAVGFESVLFMVSIIRGGLR